MSEKQYINLNNIHMHVLLAIAVNSSNVVVFLKTCSAFDVVAVAMMLT